MNTNYDLSLTCHVLYKDLDFDFQFDPYNDCTSLEGLKELAETEIENHEDYKPNEDEVINTDEIQIEITDFDDIPEDYANEKDCWDFAEAFAESEQEIEVIEAALYCGIAPSDIDEAYQGSYKDDEDFAYEIAESLGAIDKNASWPMTCIDWEQAAKELMYDYSEHNGYYFRNF